MLDDATVLGFKRIVGSFPEASTFAYFTVGFFAFCTKLWIDGIRPRLTGALAALSLLALAFATSSTGYAATSGFLGLLFASSLAQVLFRRVRRSTFVLVTVLPVLVAGGVIALRLDGPLWNTVNEVVDASIFDKMESSSGIERGKWNDQALANFFDTRGLGAGDGSVRASSFPLAVLGNIGIFGALTYSVFLLSMFFGRKNRWQQPFPASCQSGALGLPHAAHRRLGRRQFYRSRPAVLHLRRTRLRRAGAGAGRASRADASARGGASSVTDRQMYSDHPDRPIRVFVHLARGFGGDQWAAKWRRGEIVGLNDSLPYGYFHAAEHGCTVEYSQDDPEGIFGRMLRLGLRALLGFDFVHAWRNRQGIRAAEVVWTHTESQHLAVLLLLRGSKGPQRPKVIAQSIWLFDSWSRLWPPKRWLFASLIADADVLTTHSPENLKRARALFPRQRCQLVPYGIKADRMIRWQHRRPHQPLRVLSLGSDRHRDWSTLVEAISAWPECELRIAAPRLPRALTWAGNVTLVHPKTHDELTALYEWADLVALALKPNLHASGITVVEEATVFGLPVVCTNVGGLTAYFGDREVRYVPPGQLAALREALATLASDPTQCCRMVEQAQRRMLDAGLTSSAFARRHAELSRELVREHATQDAEPRRRSRAWAARLAPCGVALALTGIALGASPHSAGVQIEPCRLRPTFTEDFNTLSVSADGENGSRWIAHTPWNGDFGDAAFAYPQPGFPFRVQNGILDIEARRDADGKWRSGLLASAMPTNAGFAQRYGYFEMRAELPPGPGTWPGFWLNANQRHDDPNPGVEIDVIEYYGQFTDGYHSVVHVWDKADPKKSREWDHVISVPSGSLTSAFHTYGVDVEPEWITFYLDRRETWRVATPPELKNPMMVLVDLALGSGWPIDHTPNPSIMKVDYIHVFAPPTTEAVAASGDCDDD
jgi:glycosyltransferase involved in cell wall biosynthesis